MFNFFFKFIFPPIIWIICGVHLCFTEKKEFLHAETEDEAREESCNTIFLGYAPKLNPKTLQKGRWYEIAKVDWLVTKHLSSLPGEGSIVSGVQLLVHLTN
jgi:hypothetical protein